MIHAFDKYQATGNHFMVLDNRKRELDDLPPHWWKKQCSPAYGVGADGVLMLGLSQSREADFRMSYLNSDGGPASLCGNGLRALTHFAFHTLGLRPKKSDGLFAIEAPGGVYYAKLTGPNVTVKMTEFFDIGKVPLQTDPLFSSYRHVLYLNTGVPHVVVEVDNLQEIAVNSLGRKMREHSLFVPEGANINFFQISPNSQHIAVRTYERGVERETLSCGTGSLAVALACAQFYRFKDKIQIQTRGGELLINFDQFFENIWMEGPVGRTFWGQIEIPD